MRCRGRVPPEGYHSNIGQILNDRHQKGILLSSAKASKTHTLNFMYALAKNEGEALFFT